MCGPKETLLLPTMAATCVAIVVLSSSPAFACRPPACSGGAVLENRTTIPANAEGFVWSPLVEYGAGPDAIDTSELEVTRVDQEGSTPVPVEVSETRFLGDNVFLVKPTEGLEPNSTYDVRAANFCHDDGTLGGDDDLVASVQTVGQAQSFSDPGSLEIVDAGMGEVQISTFTGSCSEMVDAYKVTIQLNPSDGLRQWSGGLIYRFFASRPGEDDLDVVDTVPEMPPHPMPVSPELSLTRPQVSAALACDSRRDGTYVTPLESGTWDIHVQAEHPPTGKRWTSDPVEVTLSCEQGGDTGVDAGPSTRWPEGSGEPGGCFCSSNDGRRPFGGALIVFLMGVVVSRWTSRSPSAQGASVEPGDHAACRAEGAPPRSSQRTKAQ